MRYFVQQLGSEQKLEEYLGKSIIQIKADYKDDVRNMLLSQSMQSKITSGVTVTPADVRSYYNAIPPDSLPLINSEVEVGQIVKMPPVSKEEKKNVKDKLNKIRDRIINGEDFATLAVLYSEDGSAKDGGELGFRGRDELVPEFSSVAFELKGSEISKIVESPYGYHIIQLIERRGELINVRHILMSPKNSSADILKAQQFLDSVYTLLKTDSMTFSNAAAKFSDDAESKYNGGLIVNPQTGTNRFETSELDPTTFFTIDKLKPGQYSQPVKFQGRDGKPAYRLLYLKTRTEPHRANLKEDYQQIQNVALAQKQAKVLGDWVKKKKATTYIKLDDEFKSCGFQYQWVN
jgi:peptidyl-prolyl cis-trans isomerase SurA